MDSIQHKEKNEKLIEVLREISDEIDFSEENFLVYYNKFREIYITDFRHDYSEVSRFLFSIVPTYDARVMLAEVVKDIYNVSSYLDEDEESCTTQSLRRLNDHINLENIRMTELERISREANSASEIASDVISEISDYQDKLMQLNDKIKNSELAINRVDDKMKSSSIDSITILSIFAGIVITFTGGLSFISNALSGINRVEPYRLAIFILMIGIVMFNAIFLLLYMLGKITGRYTGSSYGCIKVRKQCNSRSFSCYIIKYPHIAWFNMAGIIGIAISYYLSIVDRFDVITKILNKQYSWLWTIVLSSLILFLVITTISIRMKKVKCKKLKS